MTRSGATSTITVLVLSVSGSNSASRTAVAARSAILGSGGAAVRNSTYKDPRVLAAAKVGPGDLEAAGIRLPASAGLWIGVALAVLSILGITRTVLAPVYDIVAPLILGSDIVR